jgi:hypothetical protein
MGQKLMDFTASLQPDAKTIRWKPKEPYGLVLSRRKAVVAGAVQMLKRLAETPLGTLIPEQTGPAPSCEGRIPARGEGDLMRRTPIIAGKEPPS